MSDQKKIILNFFLVNFFPVDFENPQPPCICLLQAIFWLKMFGGFREKIFSKSNLKNKKRKRISKKKLGNFFTLTPPNS